jgi:hypothetical protein
MGLSKIYNVIKAIKPQVKKTGTKDIIEHFKKTVTGLNPEAKASIYKTHVAPYVKKWSGKKGDLPSKKKK